MAFNIGIKSVTIATLGNLGACGSYGELPRLGFQDKVLDVAIAK